MDLWLTWSPYTKLKLTDLNKKFFVGDLNSYSLRNYLQNDPSPWMSYAKEVWKSEKAS